MRTLPYQPYEPRAPFEQYESYVPFQPRMPFRPRMAFESSMPFEPHMPFEPRMPFEPCQPYHQHCTPMYNTVDSGAQTVYQPNNEDIEGPFSLKFITNRISKCQGCKGSLKRSDNSLPMPPNDLIVSRMERRPFVAPDGTVRLPSKSSASHYHLKMECLTAACASFDPRDIVTPPDVSKRLTPQHFAILSALSKS